MLDGRVAICWYSLIFWGIDCAIKVIRSFSAWKTHGCTPQRYRTATTIFISFYAKFKYYIFSDYSSGYIKSAWKCYTSHPLGATPSLCIWEYLQIKIVGVSILLIFSYPTSTLPFALTSNHCYNTEPISHLCSKYRSQYMPLL